MTLESVGAIGGSGQVLLKTEFRYAEEVEIRCGPSPSKLCIEKSDSLPLLLLPLASNLNYSHGSEVHLWLNRGAWNAEAWGEWWERENPSERGATGSGAFLEMYTHSLSTPKDGTGTDEDKDVKAFSRIRSSFGVFCPSFSPSGADGQDLNMQFVAGKLLMHQGALIQHSPDSMICTDKARDWMKMLLPAVAFESELATILSEPWSPGNANTNSFTWFVQAQWAHLGLDYHLQPSQTRPSKTEAEVTVRLSAMLDPLRIKSHQRLLSGLREAGYKVPLREEEPASIAGAGDAPPISVHRILRDGRGTSMTSVLYLDHKGAGTGSDDNAVHVHVIEPWDEQVFDPLWSKYEALMSAQDKGVNKSSSAFRLPDHSSFRLPKEKCPTSTFSCDMATWSISLSPGQSIVAALPVMKRHRHRDLHAADASRGIDVAPAIVTVCTGEGTGIRRGRYRVSEGADEGTEKCWQLLTEAATVTTPLPDFPMPFHVLTLVSTLMAFLLGSLINTIFKEKRTRKGNDETVHNER